MSITASAMLSAVRSGRRRWSWGENPRRGSIRRTPRVLEALGNHRVNVEMDGPDGIGVERVAVQQSAFGHEVVGVDEDHDAVHSDVHFSASRTGGKRRVLTFI